MARSWREVEGDVRGDLVARVDAIDRQVDRLRPCEIAGELDAVRRIARAHDLGPALTVVHAIDSALARGEHGALIHDWLGVLRDAVGCQSYDRQACETFAAVCTVRQVR